MGVRQMFSDEEWRTLQFAPLWVFAGVASADRGITEEEMAALSQEVEEAQLYDDPLVREVLGSLRAAGRILDVYHTDDRDMDAGLTEVAALLDGKVAAASATAFRQMLLFVGRRVAQASPEAPLAPRRVSEEEHLSLFRVADLLGLDLPEDEA